MHQTIAKEIIERKQTQIVGIMYSSKFKKCNNCLEKTIIFTAASLPSYNCNCKLNVSHPLTALKAVLPLDFKMNLDEMTTHTYGNIFSCFFLLSLNFKKNRKLIAYSDRPLRVRDLLFYGGIQIQPAPCLGIKISECLYYTKQGAV